ncbi:MAG: hypothetical protein CL578_05435 [Alteromonadaceae bacterium]|uniref:hypothetical protein n=1 Tax=uncultured Paraglaciecola sp. TaxID=1765024 RepID=UPI000C40505F|nr:hypothetical protein [Alteromonadaceae bacterium]|tara:strand:- start:245 stop:2776 length:2532 start_codon:yes stop_codon:yes gene_type:complete
MYKSTFEIRGFIYVITIFMLLGCGDGGINNKGENSTPVSALPSAAEIRFAASTSSDTIYVTWLASEDETEPSEMQYEVHGSVIEGYTPSQSTKLSEVTGKNEAFLIGLDANTIYHLKVIAIDEENQKVTSNSLEIKTVNINSIVRDGVIFSEAENLNLLFVSQTEGLVNFRRQTNTIIPAINDYLSFTDDNGIVNLVQILDLDEDEDNLDVYVREAVLSELIEAGSINLALKFHNDSELRPSSKTSSSSTQAIESEGVDFDGRKLIISDAYSGSNSQILIDSDISFSPVINYNIEWDLSGIKQAYIDAHGAVIGNITFKLISELKTELSAKIEEIPAFSKTIPVRFVVAGITVFLDVDLTTGAELSFNSVDSVTVESNVTQAVDLQVLADYSQGSGWTTSMSGPFFSQPTSSLSIDVAAEGNGSITFIPKVKITAYQFIASEFTIEPSLRTSYELGDSTSVAHISGVLTTAPLEFETFDILAGLDCNLSVGFEWIFFSGPFYGPTNLCSSLVPTEIFGLPDIKLQQKSTASANIKEVHASVDNHGLNNFDDTSIIWEVYPDDGAELIQDELRSITLDMSNGNSEKYHVLFSGYDLLGEVSRRVRVTELTRENVNFEVTLSGRQVDKEQNYVLWNTINQNNHHALTYKNTLNEVINVESINSIYYTSDVALPIPLQPFSTLTGILSFNPTIDTKDISTMVSVNTLEEGESHKFFVTFAVDNFAGRWQVQVSDKEVKGKCDEEHDSFDVNINRISDAADGDIRHNTYFFEAADGVVTEEGISPISENELTFTKELKYKDGDGETSETWVISISRAQLVGESTWSWLSENGLTRCSGKAIMNGIRY